MRFQSLFGLGPASKKPCMPLPRRDRSNLVSSPSECRHRRAARGWIQLGTTKENRAHARSGLPAVMGCVAALSAAVLPARPQEPGDYRIKAAFLFNFAKFVEWPDAGTGPLDICIAGDDPFGSLLDDTVKGKTINARPVEIKRDKTGKNLQGCHIVFISASERHASAILDSLRDSSTLTVGESPGFASDGGIINFALRENRVHFEINTDVAERAHLKISSRLLSLATIVKN